MGQQTHPYGSWPSPITADVVVAGSVGLGGPAWAPALGSSIGGTAIEGWLWWSELRPAEKGRVQLVRRAIGEDGQPVGDAIDVLPDGFSSRTRVHEYGGGAWWLGGPAHPDTVFFTNWDDQRLYRFRVGDDAPVAVTPEPDAPHALRYADGEVTRDGRWVVCVRESHVPLSNHPPRPPIESSPDARNEIAAFRADVDEPTEQLTLVSGPDFVSNPRLSPDQSRLCWIEWDHPNMPWDETRLRVADVRRDPVGDGPNGGHDITGLSNEVTITDEAWHDDRASFTPGRSWIQPQWVEDADQLWVITDPSYQPVNDEFWPQNHWILRGYKHIEGRWQAVDGASSDYETGTPQWVFGQSDYCIPWSSSRTLSVRPHGIVHAYLVYHHGTDALGEMRIDTYRTDCRAPFTSISGLTAVGDRVGMIGASFTSEPEVVLFKAGTVTTVRPARELGVDETWFSVPRHIEFPTTPYDDGTSATAYALYYPPNNPEHTGPAGEKPPLLVLSHGGPTSAARSQLQLSIQFWTSRGVAVADVNYRGSTGYGRAYRDALRDKWGIYDTDDCIAAARFLVEEGEVDAGRLIIKGGSAGGYTTLCALTFHDDFAAGSSLYGVADLGALARDTHKFESRYLDSIVGPWPEAASIYDERSPISHTDRLATPLIIFQGLEDEVVPPSQAEMMVDALRSKGVPFAYLPFEGEQHGFRQAANIKRVVEAELYFFGQMLGFDPADEIDPVSIERG